MKSHVMGIDFGSTTAKTVILDLKGRIVSSHVAHMGAVSGEGVRVSVETALAEAGLTQDDIGRTVSTGYGRRMLDIADKNYTEITCHARGAVSMVPDARLVIDIGGQDSKVIAVDANGLVAQFAMNDRCAAGTGKFLEVLARAMDIPLESMGDLALQAQEKLKILEHVRDLRGDRGDLAACRGPDEARRARRGARGHREPHARPRRSRRQEGAGRDDRRRRQNRAAVHHIQEALGMPLHLPESPQIAGALGAALLGLDDYRAAHRSELSALDDDALEAMMGEARACAPGCRGVPAAVPQPVATPADAAMPRTPFHRVQTHL